MYPLMRAMTMDDRSGDSLNAARGILIALAICAGLYTVLGLLGWLGWLVYKHYF
jgi:hypothetical protein